MKIAQRGVTHRPLRQNF